SPPRSTILGGRPVQCNKKMKNQLGVSAACGGGPPSGTRWTRRWTSRPPRRPGAGGVPKGRRKRRAPAARRGRVARAGSVADLGAQRAVAHPAPHEVALALGRAAQALADQQRVGGAVGGSHFRDRRLGAVGEQPDVHLEVHVAVRGGGGRDAVAEGAGDAEVV